MHVDSLEALFLVELRDVYDAEHRLVDALADLAERTDREEIAAAFADHRSQTEGHVERLETVFDAIGEDPQREECQALKGMIAETERFYEDNFPSIVVGDRYAVTAAQKVERYEITAYENLLQWADEANVDAAVSDALRATLDEETESLATLQGFAEEFDYEKLTV